MSEDEAIQVLRDRAWLDEDTGYTTLPIEVAKAVLEFIDNQPDEQAEVAKRNFNDGWNAAIQHATRPA